jgi:hypothetical protein
MKHLNLELEKLEKRIAPGGIALPLWAVTGGDCGSHASGGSKGSGSKASGGSKSAHSGSKGSSNGGSKGSC